MGFPEIGYYQQVYNYKIDCIYQDFSNINGMLSARDHPLGLKNSLITDRLWVFLYSTDVGNVGQD